LLQPEIKLQFLGPQAHIVVCIVITLSQLYTIRLFHFSIIPQPEISWLLIM